jgi:hypothetical protein
MIWFNISPIEGHLKVIKRIQSYLNTFSKGSVIIDISYPNHSVHPVEDHSNWVEFYPDAGEEIPKDLPAKKGPKVRMTVYVYADHAHDSMTRRSIAGILVMLKIASFIWISKRHKIAETSTYGLGLVALRVAKELILEVRYMLRSFGVTSNGRALVLGDNMSVVLNTTFPSSDLNMK